jgi:branched-chain amino acid transport system ATP-binding protein
MLTLTDLRVRRDRAEVLHGISFEAPSGEIVGIIGPNGAGKTTALLALSGVLKPHAGSIRFRGDELVGLTPAEIVRRGIVHVPQGRLVFPAMTVLENLQIGAYGRKGADAGRTMDEVFELFPVLAERRAQLAGSLSGGQQQMLAIGRGLMARPEVLLLDEPQLGLAPLVIEAIARAIRRIHERGQTIVVVGQHAAMVVALASRIYVMEAGHVVVSGDTESVMSNGQIQNAYLGVA